MDDQKPLLRNPGIFPADEELRIVFGKEVFRKYKELMNTLTSDQFGLKPEWNYYKDGKAWLCKVIYKKKTIFWLSVWKNSFKIVFYFTEKTRSGVLELDIKETIKNKFANTQASGKLIPLIFEMDGKEQLDDLLRISKYKMNLK